MRLRSDGSAGSRASSLGRGRAQPEAEARDCRDCNGCCACALAPVVVIEGVGESAHTVARNALLNRAHLPYSQARARPPLEQGASIWEPALHHE